MEKIVQANVQYWLAYLANISEQTPLSEADLQGAIRALDLAAAIPPTWSQVIPLANALQPYMERRGYWAEWGMFLRNLLARARDEHDQPAEIELLMKLGSLQRRFADYAAAAKFYRQAWLLCRQTGHSQDEAVALSNLGDLYRLQGHTWRAQVLCTHAVELFESLDDTLRVAYTENTIGLIYFDLREWETALKHFDRAEFLFAEIDHSHGLALVRQNMGALFVHMNDPRNALMYFQHALAHYEKVNNAVGSAKTCLNMGLVCLNEGDFSQAEHMLTQAETKFRNIGDALNLARTRHNLGMLYTHLQIWDEAERCFTWAVAEWRRREDIWNLANSQGELAELYLAWGKLKKAARCLDEVEVLIQAEEGAAYKALHRELAERRAKLGELHALSEEHGCFSKNASLHLL